MRHANRPPLSATTAIAAALALLTAPATAQETSAATLDGPIVAPPQTAPAPSASGPTAGAPTASPVVVPPATSTLPAQSAPVTTSQPVVQPIPAEAPAPTPPVDQTSDPAPAKAASTAKPATAPVVKEAAAPAPKQAAPAASANDAGDAAATSTAPVADESATPAQQTFVAPVAQDPAQRPAPTPTQTRDLTTALALILAGLIALAVGLLVFLAFRRRKRTANDRRAAEVRRKPQAPARSPAMATLAPAAASAAPAIPDQPRPAAKSANRPAYSSNGAAVALPAALPETFEERDRLIKQMVEAEPDRANPFISPKARLRRARLILQSIGQTFDGGRAWIDLSDYPHIWPELARSGTAEPARPAAGSARAEDRILEPA